MNSLEVNEASKVHDIDIISTFVHKYGRGNKIHEVCPQCTCSTYVAQNVTSINQAMDMAIHVHCSSKKGRI